VNLDITADFREQDAEKLGNLFKLVRMSPLSMFVVSFISPFKARNRFPYLTKKRFPHNWAVAEMVKNNLANRRKYRVKHGKLARRKERRAVHNRQLTNIDVEMAPPEED
jgi:hypothetical protein